jgi:hypothetical protein
MDNEPKRGDVREDGLVCWGYTWKDKDGNKRYQWLTPERFAEKVANEKEKLAKYAAENAETIRVKQAEKYERNKEYYKQKSNENYRKNKERFDAYNKQYRVDNWEHLKVKQNEYRAANRERARRWNKRYRDANRQKLTDKLRERRRNDPFLRLREAIRGSVRAYLGSKKTRRSATFEIVGCTPDFLRSHLEKQFKPGMTWENYGSHWHVDHRIPLASGNSPEEIIGLSHWTNLQPLEALENLLKSDKMPLAIDASSSQPIDRIDS